MKKYVITISRQFASMGRSIAQDLSKKLGIDFYDRDIVEETAKRMGLSISRISESDEMVKNIYAKRQYPFGFGLRSEEDEIFMVQRNIIRDFASKKSCIIVGRCANSILHDIENSLHIYIYAPYEERLKNCIEKLGMDEKTAKKMIPAIDTSRNNYNKKYGASKEGIITNCQLMIDSSHFGIEKTAEIIADIARKMFSE